MKIKNMFQLLFITLFVLSFVEIAQAKNKNPKSGYKVSKSSEKKHKLKSHNKKQSSKHSSKKPVAKSSKPQKSFKPYKPKKVSKNIKSDNRKLASAPKSTKKLVGKKFNKKSNKKTYQ